MKLKFRDGKPQAFDHTPAAAVAAGDVVLIGNVPFVAHHEIKANKKGSIFLGGEGLYEGEAAKAFSEGDKAYWDAAAGTDGQFSHTPGTGETFQHFGTVAPGESAAAAGDVIRVIHDPDNSTV